MACELPAAACGIQFPDQGSNLGPLHWESRILTTVPPVKSLLQFFFFLDSLLCTLCKSGDWNNECSALLQANSASHRCLVSRAPIPCSFPWVVVGRSQAPCVLTPLPISNTLAERRVVLFFLSNAPKWDQQLPPPWLPAQPCAPSPQCCCWPVPAARAQRPPWCGSQATMLTVSLGQGRGPLSRG